MGGVFIKQPEERFFPNINMEATIYKTRGLLHMRIAYNFTSVDRARVSHGKFMSWLAEISVVSGKISVKRASPLHM